MNDENWTQVGNGQQLTLLLDLTVAFHDAVTISSRWIGVEYLTPSRSLVLDGYGTLILNIVSQFASVPAIELRCEKVERFRYEYGGDKELTIEFSRSGIRAKLLEWEIEAESLSYRTVKQSTHLESDLD